jgi:hypothetical protein
MNRITVNDDEDDYHTNLDDYDERKVMVNLNKRNQNL